LRGVYAVVVAVVAVFLLASSAPSVVGALSNKNPDDGKVDYVGAACFVDGVSPYDFSEHEYLQMGMLGFGHPPTMPLWFLPFAGMGLEHLAGALGLIMIALLFAHCALLCGELGVVAPLPSAFLLFAATLSSWWMAYHLEVGQTSVAIAFAYLVAWQLLRRGRDAAGGAALGLACTMKLFPGLLVAWLAYRRRWRALAGAAIAFAVPTLVATIRFGVSSWPKFMAHQKPIADYWMGSPVNESLQGLILRQFVAWRPFSGTSSTATLISSAIALAMIGAFVLVERRARARDGSDAPSFDVSFALLSVLSVFLNPWVWGHYGVFLLLPIGVAVMELVRRRQSVAAGIGVLAVAGVVYLLRGLDVHREIFGWMTSRAHAPEPRLPLWEAALWAPWVIMIVVLGGLLAFRQSAARIRSTQRSGGSETSTTMTPSPEGSSSVAN
jgi:hypothetical protein